MPYIYADGFSIRRYYLFIYLSYYLLACSPLHIIDDVARHFQRPIYNFTTLAMKPKLQNEVKPLYLQSTANNDMAGGVG